MNTQGRLRLGVATGCGLISIALVLVGVPVIYGLSQEYSGGTGLQLLPLVVGAAGGAAALATWSWPGLKAGVRVGVPVAVVVVVVLGGLGADRLGGRSHEQRLVVGSESFACNGPYAEVHVDERVDATFAELPRRAPIYGPVEAGRTGCTAAVDAAGAEAFTAYADAFRELTGWTVIVDHPDRFVMQRDGVRVAMWLEGAPDQLAMIEVSTIGEDP
ncbi:MAG: hypothetical protein WKF50_11025 [Nocardioides sp.]